MLMQAIRFRMAVRGVLLIGALMAQALADARSTNLDGRGKTSGTVPSPDDNGGKPTLTICTAAQEQVDKTSFGLDEVAALANEFNQTVQAGTPPPASPPTLLPPAQPPSDIMAAY